MDLKKKSHSLFVDSILIYPLPNLLFISPSPLLTPAAPTVPPATTVSLTTPSSDECDDEQASCHSGTGDDYDVTGANIALVRLRAPPALPCPRCHPICCGSHSVCCPLCPPPNPCTSPHPSCPPLSTAWILFFKRLICQLLCTPPCMQAHNYPLLLWQ